MVERSENSHYKQQDDTVQQHRSALEAAAAVNDDDTLINTAIDQNEAAQLSEKTIGNSSSPGLQATHEGSRELIWKNADGAEKRLLLPIEMIKEDIMDDPERLLANASPDEADDAERAKILSALQEMQGSIRKEGGITLHGNTTELDARRHQLDESAIVIDKSVYIDDDEDYVESSLVSPGLATN